ncbi:MAG: hypothetical protein ACP5OA_01620 [Candidatus Woesearchaeota archaeon]
MKRDKIYILLASIIIFLLLCSIHAYATIDVRVDVEPEFFSGDTISFNYMITSDVDKNITYVVRVDCPDAPAEMLNIKKATLREGVPLIEEHKYLKVTDSVEPQECSAYLAILESFESVTSKNFTINTTSSFDFNIILNKKVFVKGEDIIIAYSSKVENPSVTAVLTYPDKSRKNIKLPYSLAADGVGTYNLKVSASKAGYKTVSLNEQFGVIKENVVVTEEMPRKDFNKGLSLIKWIIISISVIIISGASFYLWKKNKKDHSTLSSNTTDNIPLNNTNDNNTLPNNNNNNIPPTPPPV